MKLFSRLTLICNLSFVVFILLGYIEFNHKKNKADGSLIPLPFITGTLVILGQFAIFINLIFCLIATVIMLSKKLKPITPQWLVVANFIFLLAQVYYFFIF